MVTYARAAVWALSFGFFFHLGMMSEHHSVIISIGAGAFWTILIDRLISGVVSV